MFSTPSHFLILPVFLSQGFHNALQVSLLCVPYRHLIFFMPSAQLNLSILIVIGSDLSDAQLFPTLADFI